MKKLLLIILIITSIDSKAQFNLGLHIGSVTSFMYRGTGGEEPNQIDGLSPAVTLNAGYKIKYFISPFISFSLVHTKERNNATHDNKIFSVGIKGNLIKTKVSPLYNLGVGLNLSSVYRGAYGALAKYNSSNVCFFGGLGAAYALNNKFSLELLLNAASSSQDDELLTGTYNLKYWYFYPSIGVAYQFKKKTK